MSPAAPSKPVSERAQRAKGVERQSEIVEAATKKIVELGFEGLRVRDVAREVGINPATLHHHFPTKEDLISAVVAHFAQQFEALQPSGDASLTKDAEPLTPLLGHLRAVAGELSRRPEMFIVMNELLARSAHDENVARLVRPSQDAWRDHVASLLPPAIAKDATLRGAVPQLIMTFLCGLSIRWSAPLASAAPTPEASLSRAINLELVAFETILRAATEKGEVF